MKDYLLMSKFNPKVISSIKNQLRGHSFLETAKVPEEKKPHFALFPPMCLYPRPSNNDMHFHHCLVHK